MLLIRTVDTQTTLSPDTHPHLSPHPPHNPHPHIHASPYTVAHRPHAESSTLTKNIRNISMFLMHTVDIHTTLTHTRACVYTYTHKEATQNYTCASAHRPTGGLMTVFQASPPNPSPQICLQLSGPCWEQQETQKCLRLLREMAEF